MTDEAMLDAAVQEVPSNEVELWAWQTRTVEAFAAVATQWRVVTIGGGVGPVRVERMGLDYAAAKVAWDLLGITLSPDEFADVRVMESAVLRGVEHDGD